MDNMRMSGSRKKRSVIHNKVTNVVYSCIQYADIKYNIEEAKKEMLSSWVL